MSLDQEAREAAEELNESMNELFYSGVFGDPFDIPLSQDAQDLRLGRVIRKYMKRLDTYRGGVTLAFGDFCKIEIKRLKGYDDELDGEGQPD